MYAKSLWFGILAALLVPISVQAERCFPTDYTVVYINGIFSSIEKAQEEANVLQKVIGNEVNGEDVEVKLAFNPSHLEGAGDLLKTWLQQRVAQGSYTNDYDLTNMLLQLHKELKTQKVLLVGHSQGTFYTNQMYEYLITHGMSPEAVHVYNIATPASYVAGGGKYLNSSSDVLLGVLEDVYLFKPLPPNIHFVVPIENVRSQWPGHSLVGAYLVEVPHEVAGTIESELRSLKGEQERENCFEAPRKGFAYHLKAGMFVVADPLATVTKVTAKATYGAGVAVVGATKQAVARVGSWAGEVLGGLKLPAKETNLPKSHDVVKSLYGSSVSEEDLNDLLGAAAILAVSSEEPPAPTPPLTPEVEPGLVQGVEDDRDIANTTGVATTTVSLPPPAPVQPAGSNSGGATQDPVAETAEESVAVEEVVAPTYFTASTTAPTLVLRACESSLSPEVCLVPTTHVLLEWSATEGAVWYDIAKDGTVVATTTSTTYTLTLEDRVSTTLQVVAHDAAAGTVSSNTRSVYAFVQPVVINEVAWAGSRASPDEQWIEIKNRTPYAIDFSTSTLRAVGGGWSLPLQGTISALAPEDPSSGYYIVSRDRAAMPSIVADLVYEFPPLAQSGDELVLEYWDGSATTTLDATPVLATCGGWCAGAALADIGSSVFVGADSGTLSMERADPAASGAAAEHWHTNDAYDIRSRDSQSYYVYASPRFENSKGWPEAGWLCDGDESPVVSGASYAPRSTRCTYLSRFVTQTTFRAGGLYRGEVGSSTMVALHTTSGLNGPRIGFNHTDDDVLPGDAVAGEKFFIIIFEWRPSGVISYADTLSFDSYARTGHPLKPEGNGWVIDEDSTSPPHDNYRIFEWVYSP